MRRGCTRQGIDYTLVRTGDYLDAVLSKFLHHRMASALKGGGRRRRRKAMLELSRSDVSELALRNDWN